MLVCFNGLQVLLYVVEKIDALIKQVKANQTGGEKCDS